MDLRRLRLFLAVVDHGGFTAAAAAIHVAQPALSLGVRELERELGATLLVRSRKGVVLTPAGEALVEPARQALRDVDIAVAAVEAVTGMLGDASTSLLCRRSPRTRSRGSPAGSTKRTHE